MISHRLIFLELLGFLAFAAMLSFVAWYSATPAVFGWALIVLVIGVGWLLSWVGTIPKDRGNGIIVSILQKFRDCVTFQDSNKD